jgi:hypothetical protein
MQRLFAPFSRRRGSAKPLRDHRNMIRILETPSYSGSRSNWRAAIFSVISGLDPAIHLLRKMLLSE